MCCVAAILATKFETKESIKAEEQGVQVDPFWGGLALSDSTAIGTISDGYM